MVEYDRIEPETETHRAEKALTRLESRAALPLEHGVVVLRVDSRVVATPVGQMIVAALANLLLRMKGIVREVMVTGVRGVRMRSHVPLSGETLDSGLEALANSLNGPSSEFHAELAVRDEASGDVTVGIGTVEAELHLGADAWRAFLGTHVKRARWNDSCALGAMMSAVLGAAEVFKCLVRKNTEWSDGHLVKDLAFSLYNFGVDHNADPGPDVQELEIHDVAVAGAGAGGTAFLYTLCALPRVSGKLTIVEPSALKPSNLGRYLMSTHDQVHGGVEKLESVRHFMQEHAPAMEAERIPALWHEVERDWCRVITTVDTPEARWDVQRSNPQTILEAGVSLGTLYAVLRVVPRGWCLECKHPPDPEVTWKKRALRWGLTVREVKDRYNRRVPVSRADLERLADVQNRPLGGLLELEGVPFDEIPSLTECGETSLSLKVPSQAPVLPFATTAAGVALAAELVKDLSGCGVPLNNYFAHDLRFRPRTDRHVFKPQRNECGACGG